MSRLNSIFLAATLLTAPLPLMAATPGTVQAEQSPVMPGPDGVLGRHHGGGKLAGLLSPELRAAFMLRAREQTQGMTHDQKHAWRRDQVRKLRSMSDTDRQKFKADLQSRWDSLPADRKARIQQRMAERNGPPPAR